MTYARARLWLGISGVGLFVSLASVALWFDLPGRWFARLTDLSALSVLIGLYLTLHLPLDYLGGYWLPLRHGRREAGGFWGPYLRAAFVHGALLLLFAWGTLLVGQRGGWLAVLVGQLLLMTLLVSAQESVAYLLTGRLPQDGSLDPGFAGGIAGLPGSERLILPAAWPALVRELAKRRRRAAIQSGSRGRGLLLALVWNLAGFGLCAQLRGAGFADSVELTRTLLWFTLWSFLGLLVLPTPSRWGVFEVDQCARRLGLAEADFAHLIRVLDQRQDDEPQRAAGIETIFHPIPSVENRLERFASAETPTGAWNAARYALFLSWACGGLLGRAVHCNVGRPELWVFLPVD